VSASAGRRSGIAFAIGVALIAVSFAIYPAYLLIALLPLPVNLRVGVAVAASLLSWAIFLLGTTLAGKQGVDYLKRLLTRRKAPPQI
jgi:hypothetical protein